MIHLKSKFYALTLFALSQAVMGVSHARAPTMYVSNYDDNTVSVIDVETRQVVNTLSGFVQPEMLAWDGVRGMYVTDNASPVGRILLIDVINHTVSEIPGPFNLPNSLALNGSTGMYVGNSAEPTFCVIDTQTGIAGPTIALPSSPTAASIAAMEWDGATGMYIADENNGLVYRVDMNSLLLGPGISVGGSPFALAWDGLTGMYVTDNDGNTVSVIDTQTQTLSTIGVGNFPTGLAWDGVTGMYVCNALDDTVTLIDTRLLQTVGALVSVGDTPYGAAWDVSNGIYVTNSEGNTVSVIDTQTSQVVNIPVGSGPVGIARAGVPVLLTVDVHNAPEASLQLLGGAPVSIYGKPIPDILPLTVVQIHVPDTGVVTYPVLANIAPSNTMALNTTVVQDAQSGMIELDITE